MLKEYMTLNNVYCFSLYRELLMLFCLFVFSLLCMREKISIVTSCSCFTRFVDMENCFINFPYAECSFCAKYFLYENLDEHYEFHSNLLKLQNMFGFLHVNFAIFLRVHAFFTAIFLLNLMKVVFVSFKSS
jgi:hypothetical protein